MSTEVTRNYVNTHYVTKEMISIQSITRQDPQYSYCAAIFVVLMCDDEAKESFAIVLTTSRCHFDEMVTAHRNEVLISFCQRSHFARSSSRRLFQLWDLWSRVGKDSF